MESENLVNNYVRQTSNEEGSKSWGPRTIIGALGGAVLVAVAVVLLKQLIQHESSSLKHAHLSNLMSFQPESSAYKLLASVEDERSAKQLYQIMSDFAGSAILHKIDSEQEEIVDSITNEDQGFDAKRPKKIWDWSEFDFLQEFLHFQLKNSKYYSDTHERYWRYQIFKHNVHFVSYHNSSKAHSYTVRMNSFGDLTQDEFSQSYLGYRADRKSKRSDPDSSLLEPENLPPSVDWRDRGCVTPVKNQAHCGSCWAFSVTGAIEGNYCAKTGKLVNLSEQQLVDCSRQEGNLGCNGGLADAGFEYVLLNGGLCSEAEYPYDAKQEKCRSKECKNVVDITGFKDIPTHSEYALEKAIALHGPIAVAIEADKPEFQFYGGGVFSGSCGTHLNHAVLAVGYGAVKDQRYWLVKNSWGPSWGSDGFIRILRRKNDVDGECGILLDPSYPVFA